MRGSGPTLITGASRACCDGCLIVVRPTVAACTHDKPPLRATRANRVFDTDEKRIRIENTVIDKNKVVRGGFYTRSSIAHGCAFHPCAIDDPRGRSFVRAKSQLCNDGATVNLFGLASLQTAVDFLPGCDCDDGEAPPGIIDVINQTVLWSRQLDLVVILVTR